MVTNGEQDSRMDATAPMLAIEAQAKHDFFTNSLLDTLILTKNYIQHRCLHCVELHKKVGQLDKVLQSKQD